MSDSEEFHDLQSTDNFLSVWTSVLTSHIHIRVTLHSHYTSITELPEIVTTLQQFCG